MAALQLKRVQTVVNEFYNYVRPIKNLATAEGRIEDLGLPHFLYLSLFDRYQLHCYQVKGTMEWAFKYANGLGWDPDDLSSYIHKVYTDKPTESHTLVPNVNAAHVASNLELMIKDMRKGFNKENQITALKDIFFRLIEMDKLEGKCCIYAFTKEQIREVSHPFCLRPNLDGILLKLTSQIAVPQDVSYRELVEVERSYRKTFQNRRKNYLTKCNDEEKLFDRQQLFNLFDQKLARMFSYYMSTWEDRDKLGYEFENINLFLDESNVNLMYDKACMVQTKPQETRDRKSMVISFLALLNFASHLGVDLVEERLTELANQDNKQMVSQNGWQL